MVMAALLNQSKPKRSITIYDLWVKFVFLWDVFTSAAPGWGPIRLVWTPFQSLSNCLIDLHEAYMTHLKINILYLHFTIKAKKTNNSELWCPSNNIILNNRLHIKDDLCHVCSVRNEMNNKLTLSHLSKKAGDKQTFCSKVTNNADKQKKQGQHRNSPSVSNIHSVDSGDDGEVTFLMVGIRRWRWYGIVRKVT